MTSAVDGLKQRFAAMSQPMPRRTTMQRQNARLRTYLAMACLPVPVSAGGFLDAVSFEARYRHRPGGRLCRPGGQVDRPDLDLVVYGPHASLIGTKRAANNCGTRFGIQLWEFDQSVRTPHPMRGCH